MTPKKNVTKDINDAGFDLKLDKNDLFELALEEMINRKQAELANVQLATEGLNATVLTAQTNKEKIIKKQVLNTSLFKECLKLSHNKKELEESLVIKSDKDLAFIEVGSYYGHGRKNDNEDVIYLKFLLKVEDKNIVKEHQDALEALNIHHNQISAIKQEIFNLEKNPRKAKVAMLKQMLAGSEAGNNILEHVKNAQIDTSKLLPAKK